MPPSLVSALMMGILFLVFSGILLGILIETVGSKAWRYRDTGLPLAGGILTGSLVTAAVAFAYWAISHIGPKSMGFEGLAAIGVLFEAIATVILGGVVGRTRNEGRRFGLAAIFAGSFEVAIACTIIAGLYIFQGCNFSRLRDQDVVWSRELKEYARIANNNDRLRAQLPAELQMVDAGQPIDPDRMNLTMDKNGNLYIKKPKANASQESLLKAYQEGIKAEEIARKRCATAEPDFDSIKGVLMMPPEQMMPIGLIGLPIGWVFMHLLRRRAQRAPLGTALT